ncbi:MAG: hypothetical protein OEZ06_24355 [Myxococcales bacterium]|nr:hypothetical protein [Myxococcales bacterium]
MDARAKRISAELLATVGLLACGTGGQTGDEDAVPRPTVILDFPTHGGRACWVQEIPVVVAGLDDDAAAGFSPADVLRLAEGSSTETLRLDTAAFERGSTSEGEVKSDQPQEEPIEIEVEYANGALRYFGSEAPPCPGRLDIEVRVRLSTPSGALDETVDAVLMAHSADEAWVQLRFRTALVHPTEPLPVSPSDLSVVPVHSLAGTLGATGSSDGGANALAFLEIWLTFSHLGINGHAEGWIWADDSGLRLAPQLVTVGDVCEAGSGFPIGPDVAPRDDELAPSTNEVVALLNGLQLSAVRDDASREAVDLDFAYSPQTACGYPGDDTLLIFEAIVSFAAELSDAVTLDASWPVEVKVRAEGLGALQSVSINTPEESNASAENLESQWGVFGLSSEGYGRIAIEFEVTVEAATETAVSGELWIRGYVSTSSAPVSGDDGDVLGHLRFEGPESP